MKFLDWLNALSPTLKFTIVHGDNVQYLATTVYDENGVLKRRIYSKPTDTHAYLPPRSCHPIHTCEAIPDTVARRLKKLNSEETD